MKILLTGYYGRRNIGDDLFVHQLVRFFDRQETVEKISISCGKKYYNLESPKVTLLQLFKLSRLQRAQIIFQHDRIAWGGGTLNFGTNPKELSEMQAIAKFFDKQFAFLGVGLEGLRSENNQIATRIFNRADFVYTRDPFSFRLALERLKKVKVRCLGGDLAFYDLSFYTPFQKPKTPGRLKNIAFSGRHWWGKSRAEFYAAQLLPVIEKYDATLHLLPAHVGSRADDNAFHELLKTELPEGRCWIYSWQTPEEFMGILGNMDFHIGNRLHTLILSDLLGVPSIGIDAAGSKLDNYLQKSAMLPQQRLVDFMEPIPLEQIEAVRDRYTRPDAFILGESETTNLCLQAFLEM